MDVDRQKVDEIEAGRSPIVEPGLDELVAAGRKTERPSRDDGSRRRPRRMRRRDGLRGHAGAERRNGEPRTCRARERRDRPGAARAEKFVVVVYRSTVPPGTVDGQLRPVLERESSRRANDDFGVAMAPEFLREGSGIADFFEPPFIVAGVRDERTLAVVTDLFAGLERPTHSNMTVLLLYVLGTSRIAQQRRGLRQRGALSVAAWRALTVSLGRQRSAGLFRRDVGGVPVRPIRIMLTGALLVFAMCGRRPA